MRLDHIAYRIADREKAADFFCKAFGYAIFDSFTIEFKDGTCAKSYVLMPPEVSSSALMSSSWARSHTFPGFSTPSHTMHMPPEIFVSEGSKGSIVDKWVTKRAGIGGVHHLAFEVEDVMHTMDVWRANHWAEFTTPIPIRNSDDLEQCFTKPHPLTGVIYEFIKRGKNNRNFNVNNVRDLMESTSD